MAIKTEIKGDKLIITCDIDAATRKAAPLSKTGKSRLVASTNGFMRLDNGLSLSLNLSIPPHD